MIRLAGVFIVTCFMASGILRRIVRFVVWGFVLVIVGCGIAGYFLYRGTQHVPEFYQEAMGTAGSTQQQQELGQQLERLVAELHNDVRREGRWEAEFTDEELNAWFAADLPEKAPDTMPAGVGDPRIRITPERVQLACKYESEWLSSVITVDVDVYLTDKPNQLAVQTRGVRAGRVPLPYNQLLDRATGAARRSGIHLRWAGQKGDPVALVQVPAQHKQFAEREIHLETLELRDGAIYMAGRTERTEE